MPYVVYHKETTQYLYIRKPNGTVVEYFKTEAAAKGALTRAERDGKLGKDYIKDDFAVAELRVFKDNIEKTCTVTNIMTGEEVEESVNTPNYLSVGSESYWSM